MWASTKSLQKFYQSPLGRFSAHVLQNQIEAYWPNCNGLSIAGIGFCTPFLEPLTLQADRVLAFMPAQQGVVPWQSSSNKTDGRRKGNLTSAVLDAQLPIADISIDRLLIAHRLEQGEGLRRALREYWRILRPEGQMLVLVPNRASIWARSERTPFGYGSPFSVSQLRRTLEDNLFLTQECSHHLFSPPFDNRTLIQFAPSLERMGRRWFPIVGGVILMRAIKRVQTTPIRKSARFILGQKLTASHPSGAHTSNDKKHRCGNDK